MKQNICTKTTIPIEGCNTCVLGHPVDVDLVLYIPILQPVYQNTH